MFGDNFNDNDNIILVWLHTKRKLGYNWGHEAADDQSNVNFVDKYYIPPFSE